MVFSSLTFLFAYLPAVLAVYFLVPFRFRNLVLLVVSLFFYGWGEPVYILVMIFSILFNWVFGRLIGQYRDTDRKKAQTCLAICIALNLLLLGFFKYFDFLADNLNALALKEKAKDIPGKVAGCIDLPMEKAQQLYALLYELLENKKEQKQ